MKSDASALSVSPPSVLATALKPAEDGDGVILRLEEQDGAEVSVTIAFHPALRIEKPTPVSILEEPRGDLDLKGFDGATRRLGIPLRPRETIHIRLSPFRWPRR